MSRGKEEEECGARRVLSVAAFARGSHQFCERAQPLASVTGAAAVSFPAFEPVPACASARRRSPTPS